MAYISYEGIMLYRLDTFGNLKILEELYPLFCPLVQGDTKLLSSWNEIVT